MNHPTHTLDAVKSLSQLNLALHSPIPMQAAIVHNNLRINQEKGAVVRGETEVYRPLLGATKKP
jgi:hypothetical protein